MEDNNREEGPSVEEMVGNAAYGSLLSSQWEYPQCAMKLLRFQPGNSFKNDLMKISLLMHQEALKTASKRIELVIRPNAMTSRPSLFSNNYVKTPGFDSFLSVPLPEPSCTSSLSTVSPQNGVFIITGGMGSLGLVSANVLLSCGFSRIALISRSGKASENDKEIENSLYSKASNCNAVIRSFQCDVNKEEDIKSMLQLVRTELCDAKNPLVGIIHSAGILRDGLLCSGKAEAGANDVWNTKNLSCFYLNEATIEDKHLKYFINFSSLAASVGNVGQTSYGCANRGLEYMINRFSSSSSSPSSTSSSARVWDFNNINIRWPGIIGSNMGKIFDKSIYTIMMNQEQVSKFIFHILTHWDELLLTSSTLTLIPKGLIDKMKGTWFLNKFDLKNEFQPKQRYVREKEPSSPTVVPGEVDSSLIVISSSVTTSGESSPVFTSSSVSPASHSLSPSPLSLPVSDEEEKGRVVNESSSVVSTVAAEDETLSVSTLSGSSSPTASSSSISPSSFEIAAKIKSLISGLLGEESIDIYVPLLTLGLDSITAAELALELSMTFQQDFPATLLYNYPSIDSLSKYIYELLHPKKEEEQEVEAKSPGPASTPSSLFKTIRPAAFPLVSASKATEEAAVDVKKVLPGSVMTDNDVGSVSRSSVSSANELEEQPLFDEVCIVGVSMDFPNDITSLTDLYHVLSTKSTTVSKISPSGSSPLLSSFEESHNKSDNSCLKKDSKDATSSGFVSLYSASNNTTINSDPTSGDTNQMTVVQEKLQYGHFLTRKQKEDKFDANEFKITANENDVMDLSHKLLLMNVKRALEDAGYSSSPVEENNNTNKGFKYCRNTGVFIGIGGVNVSNKPFSHLSPSASSDVASAASSFNPYSATANTTSVAAGRVSYSFGFNGPCMSIDTACSSSLVALHSARRALQLGECDLAVVGGINLINDSLSLACTIAGMTSSDGLCRSFDVSADGYGRAEGCGVIVLKRKSDILSFTSSNEKETIYGTIKSSAIQQDGFSASLTAPNGLSQESLLNKTLQGDSLPFRRKENVKSAILPESIAFLEAHGTGTVYGDPVETTAIAKIYGNSRKNSSSNKDPLYITSIKANIGHLEAASGLAGIFSTILALQLGKTFPNAHLKQLNPLIQECFDKYNTKEGNPALLISSEGHQLKRDEKNSLFLAGISSFGYSGTIAHIIIEEPSNEMRRNIPLPSNHNKATAAATEEKRTIFTSPARKQKSYSGTPDRNNNNNNNVNTVVVSSSSSSIDSHLSSNAMNFAKSFFGSPIKVTPAREKKEEDCEVTASSASVTHTAAIINKKPLPTSLFSRFEDVDQVLATSAAATTKVEEKPQSRQPSTLVDIYSPSDPFLVWQFSGQGNLKVNSCRSLYDKHEMYRQTFQQCSATVSKWLNDINILDILYPDLNNQFTMVKAIEMIANTKYSQVILISLEYSIAQLLLSQGRNPSAVTGHSLGEYTAAILSGVLTLEDGLFLITQRGKIIEESTNCRGKMIAIRCNTIEEMEKEMKIKLPLHISSQLNIAGYNGYNSIIVSGSETAISYFLKALNITASIPLTVSHAFHSPLLKSIVPLFKEALNKVTFLPFKSTKLRYYSTYLGKEIVAERDGKHELMNHDYWINHMIERVNYVPTIESLYNNGGYRHFIELGPEKVLMKLSQPILKSLQMRKKTTFGAAYNEKEAEFTTTAATD
jgi:acyl transferase domain-containing protein/NAD(P)-dependent dehydrogenase (short-subunit alcohol dehydrogenase family)/acyl carrier protein